MLGLLVPGVGMGGSPPVTMTWIIPAAGTPTTATEPIRVQVAGAHVAMAEATGSHVARVQAADAHVAIAEAMEGRTR